MFAAIFVYLYNRCQMLPKFDNTLANFGSYQFTKCLQNFNVPNLPHDVANLHHTHTSYGEPSGPGLPADGLRVEPLRVAAAVDNGRAPTFGS